MDNGGDGCTGAVLLVCVVFVVARTPSAEPLFTADTRETEITTRPEVSKGKNAVCASLSAQRMEVKVRARLSASYFDLFFTSSHSTEIR